MIRTIIVGTNNIGKLTEMQESLKNPLIKLLSYSEVTSALLDFPETGTTFIENAYEKGKNYADSLNLPVLADDGGLVFDAYPDLLGIKTARFFPQGLSDSQKNAELFKLMENEKTNRKLTLFSAISYVYPNGKSITVEEKLEGELTREEVGSQGYGFDRIFFLPEKQKTLAELSQHERDSYSPRVRALKKIIDLILEEEKET